MNGKRPRVALFDFDGTITTRDSLLPFLWELYGFWGVLKIGATTSSQLFSFLLGKTSRQQAKEAILTAAFQGLTPEQLTPKAKNYAETSLKKLVRPVALERIRWHQERGDRCVIVSASVSLYLSFWAKEYHFSDLLCSELEIDSTGCFTGKLVGKNCWGPEKLRRVQSLLGECKKYELYVYGDSRGDRELLEIADYPYFNKWC